MKRTAYLGFSLLLIGALAIPSFAQLTTPDGLYTAYLGETDPAKKTQLGEQFINNPDPAFKNSQFMSYIFRQVFNGYATSGNMAKVTETADKLATIMPSADNELKAGVFSAAMAMAYQSNNTAKTVEYGDKVLALEPGNVQALMAVPLSILATLPADGAAKDAALTKVVDYSKKLLAVSKPMGTADAEWNGVQAQANSTLGMALVLQAKYEDSIPVLEAALKLNKKDDQSHYNLGLAYSNQLPESQRAALDAFNAENAAKRARKDQFEIDELAAIASARQAEFNTKRDMAIDAFGRAVAVAGPYAPPARQQLERLWKQKNNETLDGLEPFIAQKKPKSATKQKSNIEAEVIFTMKKTACLGFSLLLIWALAIPGFGQTPAPAAVTNLYRAWFEEKDPAKKTQLAEQFITNEDPAFKASQYLAYLYQQVYSDYVKAQNWTKVMDLADKLPTLVPNADNNLKTYVFTQTMAVANQNNNAAKTVEYGDKLLGSIRQI